MMWYPLQTVYSYYLSLKVLLNNAVLPLKPACLSISICHGKKGTLIVLAMGFVEKKKRGDSCISVVSLPHGKYLFVLTRNIFISLLFKRYLHWGPLFFFFPVENKLCCFVLFLSSIINSQENDSWLCSPHPIKMSFCPSEQVLGSKGADLIND